MKKMIVLIPLFLLSGLIYGQQQLRAIVLHKKVTDAAGTYVEEVRLSGKEATIFDWPDQLSTCKKVVLFYRHLLGEEAAAKKGLHRLANEESLLSEVSRIRILDSDGKTESYDFTPWEGMPEGKAVQSRIYSSRDHSQNNFLPNLYVEKEEGGGFGDFRLIWVDSGECPDEWGESDLDHKWLRMEFIDQRGRLLLLRTLSVEQEQPTANHPVAVMRVVTELYQN